jgi:hypothetical protein
VKLALACMCFVAPAAPQAAPQDEAPERHESVIQIATLTHPPLAEVSGIARSSYPGVFWVHNDSGDDARLFAIDAAGTPIVPAYLQNRYASGLWPGVSVVNAWNHDWEDIAVDDGMIYVAEMGNNGNGRRDLGVYVINEPNPYAVDRTRALSFIPVRYPDQEAYPGDVWHFDCEALFVADGVLHFLTKHRDENELMGWGSGAKLYRLDSRATDRDNVLTLVGGRDDLSLVTAADMAPSGDRLAVLTYSHVWVFERPDGHDDWLGGAASRVELPRERTLTIEAITWRDEETLLIANEQRALFEVRVADLESL